MMINIIFFNICRIGLIIALSAIALYLYSISWFLKRYEKGDDSQFPTQLKIKLNEFTPDYLTDILIKKAKKLAFAMVVTLILTVVVFIL